MNSSAMIELYFALNQSDTCRRLVEKELRVYTEREFSNEKDEAPCACNIEVK